MYELSVCGDNFSQAFRTRLVSRKPLVRSASSDVTVTSGASIETSSDKVYKIVQSRLDHISLISPPSWGDELLDALPYTTLFFSRLHSFFFLPLSFLLRTGK